MNLKEFKGEIFDGLTGKQKEFWIRETKRFADRRDKIKKNGGKYCRHTSSIGNIGGKITMCLDCGKLIK